MLSDTNDRQNLKYLQIQHAALMKWGLDIGVTRGKYLLNSIWKFMFNIVVTTCMQYGFYNHVTIHIMNIDKVTCELSLFNQCILLVMKAVLIIYKSDTLVKLIWEMNTLAERVNPSEYDKWLEENRQGKWIGKCYYYACWCSIISALLLPVIISGYQVNKGQEFVLNMPFGVILPFDDGGIRFTIFVYVLNFLHFRALSSMSVGVDTLFSWYIHAISGHFRILRIKIETAGRKIADNNHEDFRSDVGSFVRYHNKTLKFLDDLNNLFGLILWLEILFSCLQICFMFYTLANDPSRERTPFNLVAFLAITMQLAIYCFGGEKIKNENDMLWNDIYIKMPWEKMYPSERRLMLLPLIKAQREASLIGLFFNLNRNLMVYIFKTAFSFITLLGAMKEKN